MVLDSIERLRLMLTVGRLVLKEVRYDLMLLISTGFEQVKSCSVIV